MSHQIITSERHTAPAIDAGLRITRRGRLVLSALVAIPVLALSILLVGPGAQAGAESAALETYTVLAGDSMWDIAEEIAPGHDPRIVIDELLRTNSLGSTQVQPGQQLLIPAGY